MGSVRGIVCPKCGANIELKDGQRISFCSYCGSAIEYDDGVQRTEHKSDIKFSIPTIEKIFENYKEIQLEKMRIEEARKKKLEEKEKEEEERNEKIRKYIMMLLPFVIPPLLLFLTVSTILTHCSHQSKQVDGLISAGYFREYEDKNYKVVVSELEGKGFTNIETIDLQDSGINFMKNEKVESVSIKGESHFNKDDYFNPDDKIVISYH